MAQWCVHRSRRALARKVQDGRLNWIGKIQVALLTSITRAGKGLAHLGTALSGSHSAELNGTGVRPVPESLAMHAKRSRTAEEKHRRGKASRARGLCRSTTRSSGTIRESAMWQVTDEVPAAYSNTAGRSARSRRTARAPLPRRLGRERSPRPNPITPDARTRARRFAS